MAIVTFVLLLLVCLVVPSQGLLGQESLRVLRPTAIIPGRPHLPIGELRYPFPPAFNLETSRKIPQVSLRPPLMDIVEASSSQLLVDGSSHYLVRIVFLRALAFVYFVAFLVAYHQNKALLGDNGITPARFMLQEAKDRAKTKRERREAWVRQFFGPDQQRRDQDDPSQKRWFSSVKNQAKIMQLWIRRNPKYQRAREVLWDRADLLDRPITTLLWLAPDFRKLDSWLDGIACTGLALSSLVFILGSANVPVLLTLWICQRSIMAVGGLWYGYGWEAQIAELGFHALFLVPLWSLHPIPNMPTPGIVMWMIRWYLFRIMMGAGLIKIKSNDKKWKLTHLSAMDYFYETQPVPNLLTRTMHFMPKAWHKFEVLSNHFVELVAPIFLILPGLPRRWLRAAGLTQMTFQAILISTGNLSFLNWLTMVPAIFCFDDASLQGLFSAKRVTEASVASLSYHPTVARSVISLLFGVLVMWLSIPVVKNLLSKRQQMNASFDPLRLINSYGAFGTVGEVRKELIIKSAADPKGEWKEYEFKVKPGPVERGPRWITPYHYRLDWQIWIAALSPKIGPWVLRFLLKLLKGDKGVLNLLDHDPWEGEPDKPKHIKIEQYRYRFKKPERLWGKGPFWERELIKQVYPQQGSATIDSLKTEIKQVDPDRPV